MPFAPPAQVLTPLACYASLLSVKPASYLSYLTQPGR